MLQRAYYNIYFAHFCKIQKSAIWGSHTIFASNAKIDVFLFFSECQKRFDILWQTFEFTEY